MIAPLLRRMRIIALAFGLAVVAYQPGASGGAVATTEELTRRTSPGATFANVSLTSRQEPGAPDWSRARVVRQLSGTNALAYITGKEAGSAQFRAVQQTAAAKLRKRGLRQTDIAVVLRIEVPKAPEALPGQNALSRLWRFFVPTLTAEVIDGYDVIAQSWDDGDNSTWEGNHYVQELSSGHWTSTNEQQQLPPQPYQANWTGCAFAGPAWLQCATINCYGQLFAGFLWMTKQHFQQCWLDDNERITCGG